MFKILLLPFIMQAGFNIPKSAVPSGSIRHNVVDNGETIGDTPKDCIEEEIRKRTVMIFVGGKRQCTGVIKDDLTIVMAGHCSADAGSSKSRKISLGEGAAGLSKIIYYDSNAKAYKELSSTDISAATTQFQGNAEKGEVDLEDRDLSVIRLGTPISGIKPLKMLPVQRIRDKEQNLIAAGFGYNEQDKLTDKLKYMKASGQIHSDQGKTIEAAPKAAQDSIRKGDSGGPVFRTKEGSCELSLAGITKGYDSHASSNRAFHADSAADIQDHINAMNQALLKKNGADKGANWNTTTKAASPARK